MHIQDIVEAFILVAGKEFECEIFNIATGISHKFKYAAERLNRWLKNVKPVHKPNPIKNYVCHICADTKKAEKFLGLKAKLP